MADPVVKKILLSLNQRKQVLQVEALTQPATDYPRYRELVGRYTEVCEMEGAIQEMLRKLNTEDEEDGNV